jgi:hypothetical protein
MCEKYFGAKGWFVDQFGNRVFSVIEDRDDYGFHARGMRGTWTRIRSPRQYLSTNTK